LAARIEYCRAQLLTRTRLDWTDKYPNIVAALANVNAKAAYLDCETLRRRRRRIAKLRPNPSGERGVKLVYYVFDLLRLDGRDTDDNKLATPAA
jgi:bifunctional non-homologous end joining protein LigD